MKFFPKYQINKWNVKYTYPWIYKKKFHSFFHVNFSLLFSLNITIASLASMYIKYKITISSSQFQQKIPAA